MIKRIILVVLLLFLIVVLFMFVNQQNSNTNERNQANLNVYKQIETQVPASVSSSQIDVSDPGISEILVTDYRADSIQAMVDAGLSSNNVNEQVATLLKLYDYFYQNVDADRSFISENEKHMFVLKGFVQSSEYRHRLLGLTILNFVYPFDDNAQTEYLISNARNSIGPFKSQTLVKMFSGREPFHPTAVRGFWHEIVQKGQSREMQGPMEAALELSELSSEDKLIYIEDIIKLMETDHYIGSVTLLTAITNYGQAARPYLNRLKVIRDRMLIIYSRPHEESYIFHIDSIISSLE